MEQEKYQFFRTGVTEKMKPDLEINFKRAEKKKIATWTPEQRRLAADWLKEVERAFNRYKTNILSA